MSTGAWSGRGACGRGKVLTGRAAIGRLKHTVPGLEVDLKRYLVLLAAVLWVSHAERAPAGDQVSSPWPDLKVKVGGQLHLWAIPFDQNDFEQNDPIVYGDPYLDEGFSVRRARLIVRGSLSESIDFGLMMGYYAGFTGARDAALSPELSEAYLDFHKGRMPHLQVGVDKVPFGGQYLSSSKSLLFVQRSVVAEELSYGRDVGVRLYDTYGPEESSGFGFQSFHWAIGAHNGSGSILRDDNGIGDVPDVTDTITNPFGLVHTVRIGVDFGTAPAPAGESNLGERSFQDVTIRLAANVGANRELESRNVGYGADASVFWGPASFQAEALWRTTFPQFTDEGLPDYLAEVPAFGWYVQAGYHVIPDTLQLAVRYEVFDGNTYYDDADDLEYYLFGLNYYPAGSDSLKLQLDYVRRIESSDLILVHNDGLYLNLATYF